jgi:hypothetical protein
MLNQPTLPRRASTHAPMCRRPVVPQRERPVAHVSAEQRRVWSAARSSSRPSPSHLASRRRPPASVAGADLAAGDRRDSRGPGRVGGVRARPGRFIRGVRTIDTRPAERSTERVGGRAAILRCVDGDLLRAQRTAPGCSAASTHLDGHTGAARSTGDVMTHGDLDSRQCLRLQRAPGCGDRRGWPTTRGLPAHRIRTTGESQ